MCCTNSRSPAGSLLSRTSTPTPRGRTATAWVAASASAPVPAALASRFARTAAPSATASSGSDISGGRPNRAVSAAATCGSRLEPPTSTTSSIVTLGPAAASRRSTITMVRSTRSPEMPATISRSTSSRSVCPACRRVIPWRCLLARLRLAISARPIASWTSASSSAGWSASAGSSSASRSSRASPSRSSISAPPRWLSPSVAQHGHVAAGAAQHRAVEGSAAQVVNQDGAIGAVVDAVVQRRRDGLGDQLEHIDAGQRRPPVGWPPSREDRSRRARSPRRGPARPAMTLRASQRRPRPRPAGSARTPTPAYARRRGTRAGSACPCAA